MILTGDSTCVETVANVLQFNGEMRLFGDP